MCALVSFPENCGINPVWSEWIWSTGTPAPVLSSVSLLTDPYFFPFFIHCLILAIPNMHDAQRGASYFNSRNLDGRTPIFSSLIIYLGWRWYNLSWKYLNYCCKGDSIHGNVMFPIFSCLVLFGSFIKSSE